MNDTRLHSLYQAYLDEQTHLKASTRKTLDERLRTFPKSPDSLNADYFRQRMKQVSPYTLKAEIGLAKRFLLWAERDISDLKKIQIPSFHESVTVEDLYTQDEIDLILANLKSYRDHALISVLYESACRVGELCSMTVENLRFEQDSSIVTAIVKGKTGTRETYLRESVPSLQRWLNLHPTGTGVLWVDERKGHRPLRPHSIDTLVRAALRSAGLEKKKKKILHMFRHTRLTELVRLGVHGQSLSKIAGWTKRSNMESVYVHLSTQDVKNEIALKVFGLDGEEQEQQRPIFESPVCPNCRHKNPSGVQFCEKCRMPLSTDRIVQAITEKTLLEQRLEVVEKVFMQKMEDIVREQKELREFLKELSEKRTGN